ncbi:MAG TPA: S41 family peptidase [Gemmatimonadaceae bacterium]|nr:S41 family peptidase [Gemmatimonadaceae bacterium]
MPVIRRRPGRFTFLVALACACLSSVASAQAPEPIRFARNAGIASDGRVAFTYQDDIWLVEADGSNPRRLTNNIARDFSPRFSPDGRWIAFTSARTGNDDVFLVSTTGGEPRQLTWFSGADQALAWTPDGKGVILSSARGTSPWGSPLYVQPVDGSVARPLGMGFARAGQMNADGSMIAFNRNLPSTWRKEYRGNSAATIAVMNVASGAITEVTNTELPQFKSFANNVFPMWGADGMIYFASERDGTFNLWRMNAQGAGAQQVTRFRSGGVFFPAGSPDGRRIVFQHDFDLYTLDVPGGAPKKLNLALAFDAKEFDVEVIAATSRAEGFGIAPNGEYMVVEYHGELVITPTEPGVGEKTTLTRSAWRDRSPVYSPDGRKIAYVSDEGGEQQLWLHDLATGTRKALTRAPAEKADVTWAQNSQKLAYSADNRIFEVDVAGGEPRELARNPAGGFTAPSYSADGNWLVFSRRDDEQNADAYVYDIKGKKEYNVSKSPWNETSAQLTPDGKTVVFTSNRDGGVNQLFAVSLARVGEDPNDPLVRERVRRATGAGGGRGGRGGGGGGGAEIETGASAPLDIRVELSGIEKRAVQLTSGTSAVGGYFLSRDGRTVYYAVGGGGFGGGGGRGGRGGAAPDNSQNGLYSVGLDGRDRRRIAAGTFAGMQPTADRRTVYFRGQAAAGGGAPGRGGGAPSGFPIERITVGAGTPVGGGAGAGGGAAGRGAAALGGAGGGGAGAAGEQVNFAFNVRVDRREEWMQLLDESYRVMKYRYYDPAMHGKDWAAIYARYKTLLKFAGTNEDVYDIANAMIGELNSSHTGVSGPASMTVPSAYTTRFLGVELEPSGARYKVSHVYRGGPADKEWLDIAVGDYVLAIDGKDVKAGDDYWKILSSTENEYVPVKVAKTADGANAKTVRIATAASMTDVRYEEWVENNRDSVEKATGGEIAYVHIRAMNQPSLERFQNEIDRFWQKKGIIVDIRNNGGGNIDQELLDILERQPYQFWNNRSGARTWGRRPRQAIVGPKVLMINARSVSDAEVTPQGFRALNLGRIVGNPTSAQVIATGSYALINGGSIRTPGSLVVSWDPTKPNNYGFDLENYGVPPDVWVKNSPADEAKSVDRELKAAIDEVMKMLRATKAMND